jgi:hypothetical protein
LLNFVLKNFHFTYPPLCPNLYYNVSKEEEKLLNLKGHGIMLKELWNATTFGEKLYIVFAAFMILTIVVFVYKWIKETPKKKLDFIVDAQKDGRVEVAKLCCLTAHGVGKVDYYEAEYMYVVNDVRYFVTYNMIGAVPIDEHKDALNADMLLLKFTQFMLMYYDKNNPAKAYSKMEIFTSRDAIRKIKTSKKNAYRDIDKDWTEPIDMVQY